MTGASSLAKGDDPEPGLARLPPSRTILIVGGGIGGLAAALALAKRGRACHVIEKRSSFGDDGAGIQIGPNGTRILALLGVASDLEPLAGQPHGLRVMDGTTGQQLTRMPLGSWIKARHGAPYWTFHRADLHTALLNAVQTSPLIRLSMGMTVDRIRDTGQGEVEAVTAAGSALPGEALIVADGLWSTAREQASGEPPLQFAGKCAFRSVITAADLPNGLTREDTHIWLSPSAHVVHYPIRGGHELAIVVILQDRDAGQSWGVDVLPAALQSRTAQFPAALRDLFKSAPQWRGWSLYRATRVTSPARGRIALLGDAAHPILPFLAQGGVMALEDAIVLAHLLATAEPGKVPAALQAYASERRSRIKKVVSASEQNGRNYHMSGMTAAVRNMVLTSSKPESLIGRYDWLYGWTPPDRL
jgi:salicylate hydroxylase